MPARGADGRFIAGVQLDLVDKLTGPMARLSAKFAPWGAKAAKAWDPVKDASERAEKAFAKAANLKQAADGMKGFSQGVGGTLQAPIKKMMEFEDIMAKVRANTFNGVQTAETQAEFKALGTFARDMGAKTKFSGVEAAEGLDILATAGFDAKSQMAALPGILDLAAASNQTIAEAAEISTSAMSQFGLKATDLARIGDVIAKTAQSSKTGLLDIGEAMKYAGVSANNAGVSIEETTAMLGALGDAGVKGSAAGTALRSIFSSLQAPNAKGKSALQFLGINTKDKAGNMRPINDILKEMDVAMDKKFGKDKNGNRRANLLKGLFDEANAASASLIIAKAGTGALEAKINENLGASGTAAKVAADMGNSTAGSARELSSAMEELQLTVGELLIPTVRDFIKEIQGLTEEWTKWSKENPGLVRGLGLLAGGIAGVSLVLWGVTTAAGAAATTWGVLTKAWGLAQGAGLLLTKGIHLMKVALLTNPITAILVGVATAAYLIYENWEPIKTFFIGVWESITSGAKAAFEWVLDKVKWVGEKIEDFRVSVMFEDEAAEYVAKKEAEAAANAKAVFGDPDDDNYDPNSIVNQGPAFGYKPEPTLVDDALAGVKAKIAGAGNPFAAAGTPLVASGAPLSPEDFNRLATSVSGTKGAAFAGDLKITIDSEGNVKGTRMQTKGNAGFAVRVNTGAQAA